ncbi:MAG: PKD domain-containing protein [Bacteroidales bacterium]|nr:PKD domain-containing protein [Bacteroidales bacterium]
MVFQSCQKTPEAMFETDETDYLDGLREFRDLEVYYPVKFINKSIDGCNYEWDFGDGYISTEIAPEHTYENAGNYIVVLTAFSENGGKNSGYSKNISVTRRYLTGLRFSYSSPYWGDTSGCFEPGCDTLRAKIFFYPGSASGAVYETPIMPLGAYSTNFAEFTINENVIFTDESWKIRFVHVLASGTGKLITDYSLNPVSDWTNGMASDSTYFYYIGVADMGLHLYFQKKPE